MKATETGRLRCFSYVKQGDSVMRDATKRRHTTRSEKDPSQQLTERGDARTESQKDRDRIQYTEAFARLAGVTQVATAGEGHVFHNRMTHTLEVAQLSLRLAAQIQSDNEGSLDKVGVRIDPDAAEAAALAHDLGHPPFGHVAEMELNKLVLSASGATLAGGVADEDDARYDGYEGNAQSFRIVTQLAAHQTLYPGLNLTRATLDAMLKYPWMRQGAPKGKNKYGAYRSEEPDFSHARQGSNGVIRSPEAQIMDHADNIAYSVHDVTDFYRAGLIPLELIWAEADAEVEEFRTYLGQKGDAELADLVSAQAKDIAKWAQSHFPRQRYNGDSTQRHTVRAFGSELIHRFVAATTFKIDEETQTPVIGAAEPAHVEMKLLQRLVWKYVINNPRLATQQHGQRHIVRSLFNSYHEAVKTSNDTEARRLVPREFLWEVDELWKGREADGTQSPQSDPKVAAARLAADIVSSFTDAQAVKVFQRMTGISTGSVTDLLDG